MDYVQIIVFTFKIQGRRGLLLAGRKIIEAPFLNSAAVTIINFVRPSVAYPVRIWPPPTLLLNKDFLRFHAQNPLI